MDSKKVDIDKVAAFAERIATPLAMPRDAGQGRFAPPGGALCLLRLIVKRPEFS